MSKQPDLSPVEKAVLKSYDALFAKNPWPPSCRQIAAHMGRSLVNVALHLQRLEAKGVMKKVGSHGQRVRT